MNTKFVCKKLNISQKALRIYEQCGIVVPVRDKNNYRNYSEDDVLKLRHVILLKAMGIPLKNIKTMLEKNFSDNKIVHGLDLQLKAVEGRIIELENIKSTLKQSINDALISKDDMSRDKYFDNVSICLNENMENRKKWADKWGFDSWAKDYDISIKQKDDLGLFKNYNEVLDIVVKKIHDKNEVNVLDIGCGTGNLYEKLEGSVNFTGMDQSIEMLLQAKKKFGDINVRMGNFLDEPFIEGEFDVVASTYAFHHLNAIEKENALNLMLRYLKPRGKIIIADLMFLNEAEKLNQKEYLCSHGREDLWEEIQDEYYTDIERFKRYSELLGCTVKYQHIVNFTWILEIENGKLKMENEG